MACDSARGLADRTEIGMDHEKIENWVKASSFIPDVIPRQFVLETASEHITVQIKRKSVVAITSAPGRPPRITTRLFDDIDASFFQGLSASASSP
jgi:hypothetical protein